MTDVRVANVFDLFQTKKMKEKKEKKLSESSKATKICIPTLQIFFPVQIRAARWFIFRPKIPIWVYFGGSCRGRVWHILLSFGKFSGHLV
jgi:hypothetical protein